MRILSSAIFLLGAALMAGGAYAALTGAPYIQMEFGWTKVIAGTTAVGTGAITVALAAVHHAIMTTARRTAAFTTAASDSAGRAATETFERGRAGSRSAAPTIATAEPVVTPAAAIEERPDPAVRVPQPEAVSPVAAGLRDTAPLAAAETTPLRAERQPQTQTAAWGARMPLMAAIKEDADAGPFHRVGIEDAVDRQEIGRYEANGSHYVLFSDGTIEVTTTSGNRRRFASMQELRDFVERQEAQREPADT